ncbi:hypothetical protein LSP03_28310 [Lysinibacillus sphaericus]|nr:hypothetical protein LSP03_28310 [Lysinibacillus sphaericus]
MATSLMRKQAYVKSTLYLTVMLKILKSRLLKGQVLLKHKTEHEETTDIDCLNRMFKICYLSKSFNINMNLLK